MRLADLLTSEAIIPTLKSNTKKQALQELSEKAAEICGLPAREIFDALLQRERLGSTGIGNGIAIPHGKLARVKSIFGIFARLERPIDFDALDGAPVDLVFLLIAPESSGADHLKALACAARMLRDPAVVATIRTTRDPSALYSIIAQTTKPHAA
ncbi:MULTISPECIES: PTS IIA-like nitrogen regulatory protein PtsN [Methylosinus]|uniref:PTS IIA-like nitrogen-regulatory protein PtsN n=1 Tax=Methylosinus trichosporium (strain ATCC 35070 / NCIMB 11131 / UNIQEM 75 / OB3b) TaxID=595536 RepID=A0A2D2D167_METT3|nr:MULTISPECIES: PTS IIA-like nitrogen regulatory protein PtsN [Methylosinus]ATQ68741.1 PTS IIA-like nitrogen-regulatory protein PtsN [Methylosinus trichosporium OB3b]OBS53099.1 PTS IIA-like nitrogen-regulatory protein PtsN [Methylosinus sp. 3S-1]